MNLKKQLDKIIVDVLMAHDVMTKLWGYKPQEIYDFLEKKGCEVHINKIGFEERAYARVSLSKDDYLELKNRLSWKRLKGTSIDYTEGSEVYLRKFKEALNPVWVVTLRLPNRKYKKRFISTYENGDYVALCEAVSYLGRTMSQNGGSTK